MAEIKKRLIVETVIEDCTECPYYYKCAKKVCCTNNKPGEEILWFDTKQLLMEKCLLPDEK